MKLIPNLIPTLALTGMLAVAVAPTPGTYAQEAKKKEAMAKMEKAGAGGFTAADKKLIRTAAQSDETEIGMAKLALSKTQNPEVKKYAQMMVTDHGKTTMQLKPIADAAGVSKPDLKAKDKATMTRLEGLSGKEFDMAYLEANAKGHREVAAKMKTEAAAVTNPDLKTFASNTLPVVEHHAAMAQDMVAKMGGAKKGSM